MKQKTSITLSSETLLAIDGIAHARPDSNRSRIIEQAVIEYVERQRRLQRERQDLEILNANADELNQETEELLAFQADE